MEKQRLTMISFKEFLYEQAWLSGDLDKNYGNKSHEWTDLKDKAILIADKIGSNHYKLFKIGSIKYFLISESDVYLGNIEIEERHSKFYINSSHSNLEGGFYNIMFNTILGNTNIHEIISDNNLSLKAIKSYNKLNDKSFLNIKIYDTIKNEYYPFTVDKLLSETSYRVSISENKEEIKEHFKDYYNRIQHTDEFGYSSALKKAFDEYNSAADYFLFGENFKLN